jgi:hypothetical protein
MSRQFYPTHPPWGPIIKWRESNLALDHLIQRHGPRLDAARTMARTIRLELERLFPALDDLCTQSCPWCPEPCCITAQVWIDFRDLLCMHLDGQPIPAAQLFDAPTDICRYLGPKGCRLPRLLRPWACTWYLCPTQTAILRRQDDAAQEAVHTRMQAIKQHRLAVEAEFIRVIT